jgi:hypothetical protein
MPTWGNDDNYQDKPRFSQERQVREVIQLTVAQKVISSGPGNNVIVFTGANNTSLAAQNVGVVPGMYVYDAVGNVSYYGDDAGKTDFFLSNNTVQSVSGNVVVLNSNVIGDIQVGQTVDFCNTIAWGSSQGNASAKPVEKTYTADTILITATRSANATVNLPAGISANQIGNLNQGWNHIQKKVNNDGTVRYIKETLVALANATASNTSSGNTSFGNFIQGL